MNCNRRNKRGLLISTSFIGLALASPALGQTAGQEPAPATGQTESAASPSAPQGDAAPQAEDIVVQGFRASLDSALNVKRQETAAVDSIVAEDIGKFPDSNLAESMQRVPGVALSRGDGGEGRNISVRGLGAQFTRVRINGMEGVSQVTGTDIRGGVSTSRSFDFITFPTEIFSSLTVRKTTSADVEEGSLGATVDLRAPKPFDQKKDFVFSATARGIYNDISKKADPRLSALVSKKFGDTFGVLGSIAYSRRHIEEYAYSAVDILPTYVAGQSQSVLLPGQTTPTSIIFPFCTPIGYTYQGVAVTSPGPNNTVGNPGVSVGADANNCSTGNPRTSTKAAYDYVMSRTGVSGRPGGGVFLPRLPRPVKSSQEQERIAGSLTLQWKPTDDTDISLDGLYARFKVDRLDTMLDARSMGRTLSNGGQPMMSIKEIEVDDNGSLIHGLWDGVDLRSEMQNDKFTSTFRQVNFNFDHRFSDSFRAYGLAGISDSVLQDNKLQVAIDANDTDNFSIDFRDNPDIPKLSYGVDPTDPTLFSFGPPRPDGNQRGQISYFDRRNKIVSKTFELNTEWTATPGFTVQTGGQYRTGTYTQRQFDLAPVYRLPQILPAGVSLSDLTFTTTGVNKNLGGNMALRRKSEKDDIVLTAASLLAGLLAALGLAQFVPDAWLGLPLTLVLVGLAGWARAARAPALFALPALPYLAALLAGIVPLMGLADLISASLGGDRLPLLRIPALPDLFRTLALPTIALLAILLDARQLGRARRFVGSVAIGVGILLLYVLAKQPLAIATPERFVSIGFVERALLTQACLAAGWYLLRSRRFPSLATILLGLGLLRLVWFDLLIFNPAIEAQAVGAIPLFNAAVLHAALAAFWLWTLSDKQPWRAGAALLTIVAALALVRQATHGLIARAIEMLERCAQRRILAGPKLGAAGQDEALVPRVKFSGARRNVEVVAMPAITAAGIEQQFRGGGVAQSRDGAISPARLDGKALASGDRRWRAAAKLYRTFHTRDHPAADRHVIARKQGASDTPFGYVAVDGAVRTSLRHNKVMIGRARLRTQVRPTELLGVIRTLRLAFDCGHKQYGGERH